MTRPVYKTARCPRGCEHWAHQQAMAQHVDEQCFRGIAWFRRPLETVLIPAKYAKVIQNSVAGHLLEATHRGRIEVAARHFRPDALEAGAALRSPIDGVAARVWWRAVKPYLDADIPPNEVLDLALRADSFLDLMPEDHLASFTRCPECGEEVQHLGRHQRMSRRCRTATAANRVEELWAAGYRDPWTAADQPPLVWGQLQVVRWKRRLVVVEFPQYNAVLIASARAGTDRHRRSQTCSGTRSGP
jgi:hypothetical protein